MEYIHTHQHKVCGVAGEGGRQEWWQGRGAQQRARAGRQGRWTVVPIRLREVGIQEGGVALPPGGFAGEGLCHAGGAKVVCKLFGGVEVGVRQERSSDTVVT